MEQLKKKQPGLRQYLYKKAARNNTPISGTFELTPLCNMNCRMCYIRMSKEEMCARGREHTAEEWIELGRICRDHGMLFLLITGGEPFLRPDFKTIYQELSKMGFVISINSNGTMITEETVAWLKETPPSRINITLYGGNNETYERLCQNPKGYDQATHAIDLLREAGIFVNINASYTPLNDTDVEAICSFAKARKMWANPAVYMFPPVRSAKEGVVDEGSRFSPERAGEVLFQTKKCQMEPEEFSRFLALMRKGACSENEEEECTRTADEHMGCLAGRASFWITWDGRMTPCGMMNQPVARPFEEGFEQGWKKICQETQKILLPPECKGCKNRFACMICGALSIVEGDGDSTKKPEYLCRLTSSYLNKCLEEGQEKM